MHTEWVRGKDRQLLWKRVQMDKQSSHLFLLISHTFLSRRSAFFTHSIPPYRLPRCLRVLQLFACAVVHTQRKHVLTVGRLSHTERAHSECERKRSISPGLGQQPASTPNTHRVRNIHAHMMAGRVGYWALERLGHYRLPHKPLPVFTTSDICCLRLHVWI